LTIFDDLGISGAVRVEKGFRFESTGCRPLRQRNEGLLKIVVNQIVKGGFDDK